jgi:hypothetical protein
MDRMSTTGFNTGKKTWRTTLQRPPQGALRQSIVNRLAYQLSSNPEEPKSTTSTTPVKMCTRAVLCCVRRPWRRISSTACVLQYRDTRWAERLGREREEGTGIKLGAGRAGGDDDGDVSYFDMTLCPHTSCLLMCPPKVLSALGSTSQHNWWP